VYAARIGAESPVCPRLPQAGRAADAPKILKFHFNNTASLLCELLPFHTHPYFYQTAYLLDKKTY
jgi:hypothetical protein